MSAPPSTESIPLAVYGTLQRDCGNHDKLIECDCRYQQECLIPGTLYDLGAYPGLTLPEDSNRETASDVQAVYGELYRCPRDALEGLDRFEGATGDRPLFARRQTTLIEPETGAWVYEYARAVSGASHITSGNWTDRA